jgi:hypothetical protein
MSTLKVSTISPLGTDATKTITIGSASNGDVAAGIFTNTPAFYVTLSSNQSIGNNSYTKVAFDTESYDTDSAFDTTNNRFIVPSGKAGKYNFIAGSAIESVLDDGETFEIVFYKNGSRHNFGWMAVSSPATNYTVRLVVTTVIDLVAGDYVETYVQHNEGGSQNIPSNSTFMTGYRLIGV